MVACWLEIVEQTDRKEKNIAKVKEGSSPGTPQ